MVTVQGQACTGYATDPVHLDLPRASGVRRSHRPWCCDCKRTFDADELNRDGRCSSCVRAVASRAAAAARRAAQEQAAAPAPQPAKATPKRTAKPPKPRTQTARVPGAPAVARKPAGVGGWKSGPERIHLPGDAVAEAYRAGRTLTQIAETHGVSAPTIARCLDEAGIPRRGARVNVTDELAERVRHLYLDRGLTQVEIATDIGYSPAVVQRVMAERNIETRRAVSRQGENRASSLKEQANALAVRGITVRDVKAWAVEQGLIETAVRGLPPQRVLTAYAAAHPETGGTPTEVVTRQVAAALVGLRSAQALDIATTLVAGNPVSLGPLTVTGGTP